MAKYSRYGSYFLANEKDDENPGELNITAKPVNRKRHDFVNDTDPENFADNLTDEDLPEEDLAPEGFPMGDISDEPDDPSDNIDPFPEEDSEDETGEFDDIPDFPEGNDEELDGELEDFPDDNVGDNFPTDSQEANDDINNFPDDGVGGDNETSIPDTVNNPSSDIVSDGKTLLDDIINNKIGGKLPTPDEIIDDLRKKVYGENPPEATQTNNNNSNIPDFPTDGTNNINTTNVDTQNTDMATFPGNELNPMSTTPDTTFPDATAQMPTDNTQAPPMDMNDPMAGFPGDAGAAPDMTAGGTNIVANPTDTGMEGFPGDTTDFTADAGMGGDMAAGAAPGAPMQPPGPGVGYDSMRKYNLYKEYIKLLEAIDNYITKLENIMFDEPHQNLIVKTVTDKLNEVKKLCYDYITMKFEIASYAQAYVFFEELAVSIQVIFTILMTISSYNTNQDDTSKKKSKTSNNKNAKKK